MAELSYNSWPTIYRLEDGKKTADYTSTKLEKISIGGYSVSVARGSVATIFTYIGTRYGLEVEPINSPVWGYEYRKTTGGQSMSCHASGTAIDINAPLHPWQTSATENMTQAQIDACNRIVDSCEGVVQWLKDFDPMHWQIVGSYEQAANLAERITNGTVTIPSLRLDKVRYWPTINIGSTNGMVRKLQLFLNAWYPSYSNLEPDGVFGRKTASVVKEFKGRVGMYPDSEVNRYVWAKLVDQGFNPERW